MIHYTTNGGQLHHFLMWRDMEEQVTDDRQYFVATGPHAFDEGLIVAAAVHKPGVARVLLVHGINCRTVYSPIAYLPESAQKQLVLQ